MGCLFAGVCRPDADPRAQHWRREHSTAWLMNGYNGGLYGNGKFYSDRAGRFNQGDRLGVLVDPRRAEKIFERAEAVGAEAVNPHDVLATRELIESAHERGLAVYVYTVDDPDRMRELLELGVDGIFSNYPDRLREVVDSL